MAITFDWVSDQIPPKYALATTSSNVFRESGSGDTLPSIVSGAGDTGVIGSTILDVQSESANKRTVRFIGYGNVPDMSTGISINARVIPRYSGSPGASNEVAIWTLFGMVNPFYSYLYHNTNGSLSFALVDGDGAAFRINITTATGIWSPTSGTAYDITVTWTGDTTANGVKIYIDGVLVHQATASGLANFDADEGRMFTEIILATGIAQNVDGAFDYNGFTIWNEVIDPTNVLLESGTGSLNGASRTSPIDSPATQADTWPAVGDVRQSITWFESNVEKTGTLSLPSAPQVLSGVQFGESGTEFTGTLGGSVNYSGKLDFEVFMSSLDTFMKSYLGTYITQMNADRTDLTLVTPSTSAYYFQSLTDTEVPYNPFVFYGETDTGTQNNGPESADTFTVQVAIILANTNEAQGVLGTRLLRYRECLRDMFEQGWNSVNKSVKLEVTGISPFPFSLSNTDNTHVGIGVNLDLVIN